MIPETLCFVRKYALSVLEDSQTVGQRLSDGNGMGVKEQYQETEVFSLDMRAGVLPKSMGRPYLSAVRCLESV